MKSIRADEVLIGVWMWMERLVVGDKARSQSFWMEDTRY
jgi:hypothetical protein